MKNRKKNEEFRKISRTLVFPIAIIFGNIVFPDERGSGKIIREVLLNVSLSYIAAYFFYVFQIVLPGMKNNREAIDSLSYDLNKQINYILLALFLFENFVTEQQDNQYIYTNKRQIYYWENRKIVKKFSIDNSLGELETKIKNNDSMIRNNVFYQYLNPWIRKIYSNIKIDDLFELFERLKESDNANLTIETTSVEAIKKNVELLQKEISDGSFKEYKCCSDSKIIEHYEVEYETSGVINAELLFSIVVEI